MALTPQNIPFLLSGGIDRSRASIVSDPSTFYDLYNFSQADNEPGKLIQDYWFNNYATLSTGTYYDNINSTSATESANSIVKLIRLSTTRGLFMTSQVIRNTNSPYTQYQVFHQTAVPTTTGLTGGCLIVVNSVSGLNLTLGNTFDVEIDGATTFKWRKNGGAYTTLVPITTAGVSADGGNVTVYFLTTSGFTVGDVWSWKRTDAAFAESAVVSVQPIPCIEYKTILYFIGSDSRVLALKNDGTTNYAITVGYRPVYGSRLAIYEEHLVVGNYSTSVMTTASYGLIGWSDNIDIENFIATDTNEADTFRIPYGSYEILEIATLKQQLYVFTRKYICTTSYPGLPLVFSFKLFTTLELLPSTNPVIIGDDCVYLAKPSGFLIFDGASFTDIGKPVAAAASSQTAFGAYDAYNGRVYWVTIKTMLTYSSRTRSWSRRSVDFNSDSTPIASVFAEGGVLYVGIKALKVHNVNSTLTTGAAIMDSSSGTGYATPKITMHLYSAGEFSVVKELSAVFIGALTTVVGNGTNYSTGSNAKVDVYAYSSTSGVFDGSTTTLSGTWDSSAADGNISFVPISFRAVAIELQLRGAVSGKPPYHITIATIEPRMRVPDKATQR